MKVKYILIRKATSRIKKTEAIAEFYQLDDIYNLDKT